MHGGLTAHCEICALVHKALSAIQIKDLGSGNFGVCQLMVDLDDGEHVAVKFLPRGHKVCCRVVKNTVPGRTCYSDASATPLCCGNLSIWY